MLERNVNTLEFQKKSQIIKTTEEELTCSKTVVNSREVRLQNRNSLALHIPCRKFKGLDCYVWCYNYVMT